MSILSSNSVESISTYLTQQPAEAHLHFESLLVEARSKQDAGQIQRLVAAAEPLLMGNRYLQQWHLYAQGFLAWRVHGQLVQAAALLESLRTHRGRLAPRLSEQVLNGLGIIYEMSEQWDRATERYHECIKQCEAEDNILGLGKAYCNLAVIHLKSMDFQAALAFARQSITLLSQGPTDIQWQLDLGRAWNEIGLAHKQLGHFADALAAFEAYRDICLTWDYEFGLGIAYNNLADTYRLMGNLDKANENFIWAKKYTAKSGNYSETAEVVYGMGLVKLLHPETTAAAGALFDEALALAQGADNHEIITQIYLGLAEAAEQQGDPAAALQRTEQAVDTVESLRANIVVPEARIRLQGARIEAYEQMVYRLYGEPDQQAEAFRYAEMAKSRTLIEMLANRTLRPSEKVPSAWLLEESQLRQSLRRLYEQPHPDPAQVTNLETELANLRSHIQGEDAEYGSFHTVSPLSVDQVMNRLPADGLLLEYFIAGDIILAFVITSHRMQIVELPVRLSELRRAFNKAEGHSLRHLTRDDDGLLRSPWVLDKLCQALVEPLGEIVWHIPLLCIVPHGILHYVPFHALFRRTDQGLQYLAGSVANPRRIIYAPSATTLFDYCQQKPISSQAGSLSMGYNGSSLIEAEIEATKISQITQGEYFNGVAATREILLDSGKSARYLHLSCHGVFNPTWPMGSNLSLADGPIDAADILQNLHLDAELVTLSACETGRNSILRGDELIGLSRAFLYAGTPAVLVSQWVVDEFSTRLLMEVFYRELTRLDQQSHIGSKAIALARAQYFVRDLKYKELNELLRNSPLSDEKVEQYLQFLTWSARFSHLDDVPDDACLFQHPYYWAPFFLVGERLGEVEAE